jgi:transcriptional regulator with XRE-family HTH domain
LSLSLVARIERGRREDPRLSTVKALAEELGVDVATLVSDGRPRKGK